MSVWVDENTKVLCQGMTGSTGTFHTVWSSVTFLDGGVGLGAGRAAGCTKFFSPMMR